MHFGFDDDQLAMRDAVGALLDRQCPLPAVEKSFADGNASSLRPLWNELASVGVQGTCAPLDSGGSGLDGVTLALVLAEAGRVALPLPIAETAAVGVPMLVEAGDPGGFLGELIDGSAILTVASGSLAPAASISDLFLIDDRVYRRNEVTIDPVMSVDRTRDLARVRPVAEGVPVGTGSLDRAALASAAQLIGLGREMLRTTVGFVKERQQFGVPVGSFQAVKHHLANAHLRMEFAAPAVWAAAAGAGGREAVSLAKATASDAATAAARAALQCHGAMGYTDEYRLHYWMKRTWCLAAAHGSAAWHRGRIAETLGLV